MKALIAGNAEPAAALATALDGQAFEAEVHAVSHASDERAVGELARSLVQLETTLADGRPDVAIAVGCGDDALTLALNAAKLGIPLAAWGCDERGAGAGFEAATSRIITQLAAFDAGPEGDAVAAAERISAWAGESA